MHHRLEVMQGKNSLWPSGLQTLEFAMVKGSVPRNKHRKAAILWLRDVTCARSRDSVMKVLSVPCALVLGHSN